MRVNRYTITTAIAILLLPLLIPCYGQLGISFNIKKPKEYEDRELRSERSDQKKFTLPRRFIQNTVTHYNYYYNANLKLNEVLDRAKEGFKDDYSKLLPFYNYTLDATAADSIQLDSITYKSSTGIALHDLRNDWADNLYLLWGASFYLQKKFDSAYLMFQFINYAFAPKESDGYYRVIGSSKDGNSAISIVTKEKNSLPRKIFTEPPSRNDAFIWQIRNHLALDEMAEAASLIVALKGDPLFPKRLENDLHEVQAYWFYKQNMWDSAAFHLEGALSNATNKQEKARWEYLAAQLYELAGKNKDAEKYYSKVSSHTTDPILDIYARLASIRVDKEGDEKSIEKNVHELERMAKRDRYSEYQDIIYYMAAQMQLINDSRNPSSGYEQTIALLTKSTQVTSNNPAQRNKAFLQLAELTYSQEKYRLSYNFYDSIKLDDPSITNKEAIEDRKKALAIIATNLDIVERQDSLQRIAAMPEDQRKDFVKKMVRQLRKAQGLKEEGSQPAVNPIQTNTLFPQGGNQPKGEWYFYNASSRSRGQAEFKNKWGNNRVNVDNWRRSAAIAGTILAAQQQTLQDRGNSQVAGDGDLTFDALYAKLPLTDSAMKQSNDSLYTAQFTLGKAFIQEIENCRKGTETLEQLRSKNPGFNPMDEVLFNLYYCYNKNGETAKAAAIKKLLSDKYASSNFTTIVTTGKNPQSKTANTDATRTYEGIYDMFIEGRFKEAIAAKRSADSVYGKNYWTPQLLYIEAVYYIKQREDSTAKTVLNAITVEFAGTPLAAKAANLLSVLDRRAQIEEELRNLKVTRAVDSVASNPVAVTPPPVTKPAADTATKKPVTPVVTTNPPTPGRDTVATKPPVVNNTPFTHNPATAHLVLIVLNKVDPVFVNEAKNAFARFNKDNYYNKPYTADLADLDADNKLLLIAPFANADDAIKYVDNTRPRAAGEIVPWLKSGKFSFMVITPANLELLKTNKNLEGYKSLLNQYYPGKF